ncbi:MAG: FHA domain-containing protein, partial [Anaerolineae bacterium]|nr:FHA domain-containing protein [Anaerolineae bacterium]
PVPSAGPTPGRGAPPPPTKPKAPAWLVASDGRNFQVNLGETTIGRSSKNDIHITGDTTVSNRHAKIIEANGHYKLQDVGSKNGTKVNNRRVRQPVMLDPDDEIQLGDSFKLRFVTTRR